MTTRPEAGIPRDALAQWQRQQRLSQVAAAEKLGVSRAQYIRYLTGETPVPLSVGRLAQALDRERRAAGVLHGIRVAAVQGRWRLPGPMAGLVDEAIGLLES